MSVTICSRHYWHCSKCFHLFITVIRHENLSREVINKGEELTEDNVFDPNQGTVEKDIARGKLYAFVTNFLDRLTALEGAKSSLHVFCRVDVSIFVDEDKKVSFYVNEVERGLTTCLWSDQGTRLVGHVGTNLAWPLACWVLEEKRLMAL